MAKRKPQQPSTPPPPPAYRPGIDPLAATTLGAVAIVLVVSILSLRAVHRIETEFDRKLDRVEDRIADVSDKITGPTVQAAAQPTTTPPRRGPDPARVYPIKTAGAPTKGPATAPVTIAEFSDFQ